MRAAHLHKVFVALERMANTGPAVGRLIVTSFWALLVTHVVACLWHFISYEYRPDSWLVRHGTSLGFHVQHSDLVYRTDRSVT